MAAQTRECLAQVRITRSNEIAEQMDLATFIFGRDLDPGNDFHSILGGRFSGEDAARRVMVRYGNGAQAAAAGQIGNLGGAVSAVAVRRVQMQIRTP